MSKFVSGLAVVLTAGALALAPQVAGAMGSSDSGSSSSRPAAKPVDSDYEKAVKLVEAQDYKGAVTLLRGVTRRDPSNPDAWNYLGYSLRKSGDYLNAISSYRQALAIDPDHKGAHEYLGQAYLEIGNLPAAEEQLAALDSICTFGCAEYTSLKQAVAKAKGS
ncbi:MAG: tetratricopeptide repeat protein [Pseudomonadota bacterium]|nr:tetratricopeptide repeat protein [Pseudomonadota bacterium]